MLIVGFISIGFWQLFETAIYSQNKPLTLWQINNSLNVSNDKKKESAITAKKVRQVGVTFPLTPDIESELRASGATDELIEAIRQNSPSVSKPTKTPPKPISTPVSTPVPTPKSTPTVSGKELKNSIGMEFVYIPSGSFEMGSNDGYYNEEKPVHRVTISNGFYMGKYEVMQKEYEKVIGTNPSYFKNCPRCPVEQVSWEDAQDFIKKLNAKNEGTYRLPTEAEWEYAARGGTTTKWSFGNGESSLGVYAWYWENSGSKTHEVGMRQSNDFGLYDMHGNVWEWTQDWYGSYESGNITDPTGASSGSNRVNRGGSWSDDAVHLRSANRSGNLPSYRYNDLGFRVVRQLDKTTKPTETRKPNPPTSTEKRTQSGKEQDT